MFSTAISAIGPGNERPPGPRGLHAYRFFGLGSTARALDFLQSTARKYGPISYFRVFNQRQYLIDDAELIEQVLVKDQHKFVRDRGAILLRELVGDGLLTSEEPRHRERRRVMQPAFQRAQVASYAQAIASEAERYASGWRAGNRVDIGAEMRRLTLQIVGAALFGVDFSASAARVAEILQRAMRRSVWIALLLPVLEPAIVSYRRRRPKAPSLFYARERAELERTLRPILDSHREGGSAVLSLLLEFGLAGEDLYNELVTLVLAGHETTATALTWAWYLISQHPEVEKRMREEAHRGESGFEYISMVFNEVLRLYPPVAAFGRKPAEPVAVGGYTVPVGASVILSPYITQRNERYFERPEEFLPERWRTIQHAKLAYFPFGAGAKMCIGDSFAKLEGITVLAALVRNWSFRLADTSAIGARPGITLAPARQIWMEVVAP